MRELEKNVVGRKVLYVGNDYLVLEGGWIVYADCSCMSDSSFVGIKMAGESVPPDVQKVINMLKRKGLVRNE
jgi:hypothetical protein